MEKHVLKITLYIDPVSPYAWLAGHGLAQLEAAGAEINIEPVLFAALLNAHGSKGPAEIEAKRAYTFRDVMRQAARMGLPFRGPPGHPFNPLQALRMCTALENQAERRRLLLALLAACWEQGQDISDPALLLAVANRCGFHGASLAVAAATPAVKQRLTDATTAAIAAGVFGVPTFRLGDQLFWGSDRFDALLWAMQGHGIDEDRLAAFLAQPPLAQRKPSIF
jgi:2-hydroxychromene-2-carboxylate isomerase